MSSSKHVFRNFVKWMSYLDGSDAGLSSFLASELSFLAAGLALVFFLGCLSFNKVLITLTDKMTIAVEQQIDEIRLVTLLVASKHLTILPMIIYDLSLIRLYRRYYFLFHRVKRKSEHKLWLLVLHVLKIIF